MHKPVFIGVAGGTGSGKTTVTQAILSRLPGESVALIEQDSYYRDLSDIPFSERVKNNFDHPDAFETELLVDHLDRLSRGETIQKPLYDFRTHTRRSETMPVGPRDIIVVEGILVLEDKRLRDRLDIKLFVDTDADVRILRRMVRDINERGRTMESVMNQYLSVVRPMHLQFVEPSKRYADIIIPEGGENKVAIDIIAAKISSIITLRDQQSDSL
ncbi:MAG: uridine kinase [Chloroflexota bacterium]